MKVLSQIKKVSIGTIIVSLVVGILFVAFPGKCIDYISLFVGGSLIVTGAIGIISYLIDRISKVSLAMGIITVIAGIIICVKYKAIISIIIAIIGIFILCAGIFNFITAIKVIASSLVFGWVSFALSIATIALGIISITKSTATSQGLVRFIGIALIVYAVLGVISYFQVRKLVKQVKAEAEATDDIEVEGSISQ